jgi:hypothetical protein
MGFQRHEKTWNIHADPSRQRKATAVVLAEEATGAALAEAAAGAASSLRSKTL